MPVYLVGIKDKDGNVTEKRLIGAHSKDKAEQHYIGRPTLETRTITDTIESGSLAHEMGIEIAPTTGGKTEPEPQGETEPKGDAQENSETRTSEEE